MLLLAIVTIFELGVCQLPNGNCIPMNTLRFANADECKAYVEEEQKHIRSQHKLFCIKRDVQTWEVVK